MFERWLIAKGNVFAPNWETLIKLVEKLKEEKWLVGKGTAYVTVEKGEIVTLIGSNGAGKSTTLRTISGITPPRQGQVVLEGQRIDQIPAHKVVNLGVLATFKYFGFFTDSFSAISAIAASRNTADAVRCPSSTLRCHGLAWRSSKRNVASACCRVISYGVSAR